jgi:hypothetical protein
MSTLFTIESVSSTNAKAISKLAKNWKSGNVGIQTAIAACAYQIAVNGNPDWLTTLLRDMDQISVNLTNMRASLRADGKRIWRYCTKALSLPVEFNGETGKVMMMTGWKDSAPSMDAALATLNTEVWNLWESPKTAPKDFELATMLENFLKSATSSKKGALELSAVSDYVAAAVRCQQAATARKAKFVDTWADFAPVAKPVATPVVAAPARRRSRKAHHEAALVAA